MRYIKIYFLRVGPQIQMAKGCIVTATARSKECCIESGEVYEHQREVNL
jgi:hypothetical protein